ncbi:MAG: Ppx/GppA family phosphatase [Fretibacterium sp.]|nr:Ppx/GppA family phosphatase [Fretibacterium sp.]
MSTGDREIKAAIDIGSNSIKLRVGLWENGQAFVLLDTTEVVRLGRGFKGENGSRIPGETMENAVRVVTEMTARALEMGAEVRLVGTMALRQAGNAGEFLARIREATGLDIRILSGEEEAFYSWQGAISGLDEELSGDLVMFDTGGGSTEFVFGRKDRIDKIQSVPIGAVSLTERFLGDGPVRQAALDAAMEHVSCLLQKNGIERQQPADSPSVVGLGGGVIAMVSVKGGKEPFIPVNLHGVALTQKDIVRQMRLYASLTLEERQNVIGLPPSRADVILGSACIVLCILRALDVPSCTASINGLRHGVLMEMFAGAHRPE